MPARTRRRSPTSVPSAVARTHAPRHTSASSKNLDTGTTADRGLDTVRIESSATLKGATIALAAQINGTAVSDSDSDADCGFCDSDADSISRSDSTSSVTLATLATLIGARVGRHHGRPAAEHQLEGGRPLRLLRRRQGRQRQLLGQRHIARDRRQERLHHDRRPPGVRQGHGHEGHVQGEHWRWFHRLRWWRRQRAEPHRAPHRLGVDRDHARGAQPGDRDRRRWQGDHARQHHGPRLQRQLARPWWRQ